MIGDDIESHGSRKHPHGDQQRDRATPLTLFERLDKVSPTMKTALNLHRRIAALEAGRSAPLVVRVLALTGGPLVRITCGNRTWTREPGESADDFRERAVVKGVTVADSPLVVLVEHNERSEALQGAW